MLTFYITMSTIIVHVDFLLIFMGFPRFCPHYLCYVDKSWTNCHLWTNLSFFLFLTIPYFIGGCELFTTTLFIFFTTATRTRIISPYFFTFFRSPCTPFFPLISHLLLNNFFSFNILPYFRLK